MKTFEIPNEVLPNLDGYSTPEDMKALRADFKELAEVAQNMASYCEGKELAMTCRLEGKIELARRFEAACESVYKKLPSWARW